jgi:hypothetical protein
MPSTQLSSQIESSERSSAKKKFPVTMPKQSASTPPYIMPGSKPATPMPTHLMQSVTMNSDVRTGKYLHI